MKISVTVGLGARNESTVHGIVARVQELEAAGFAGAWMPTAFGMDALTALAAAGVQSNSMALGTAVVPTFPRHPVVMAQQALTLQSAVGGRFTLGIGLSHKVMMDDALGIPYEQPARHMREYLAVLAPLLRGEAASFHGSIYNVETPVTVPGAAPVPLVVAALGPVMLKLAGEFADGTITSWVGTKTLREHIIPSINAAAEAAGRPRPRIVVGLPVAVTDDPDVARAAIAQRAEWYNKLPSYRAMLDIEGAANPAEVALVGNEAALGAQIEELAETGATELAAQITAGEPGGAQRTFEFLRSLVSEPVPLR